MPTFIDIVEMSTQTLNYPSQAITISFPDYNQVLSAFQKKNSQVSGLEREREREGFTSVHRIYKWW